MTAPPAIGADRLPPVPASPNGVMRGVAVAHAHLLDRHAELVGRDLGKGRLVALTVGHLLRVHRHGAVGLEHRARRLAADADRRSPPGMIDSWKSGGPGAASMKVANPSPSTRPSARAAA